MTTDYEEVVKALEFPGAYPERPREIEHLQTHSAHLFLTPQFVYKVKKPVDLGFLDFTTFEQRRSVCYQELALNRRISPDVYLDVAKVRRDPGGRIGIEGSGEVLEHAVKMRRLPADRSMDRLLDQNQVTDEMAQQLGRLVGEFHLRAGTSPEIGRFGAAAAIAGVIDENFRQLEPYVGRTLSRQRWDRLRVYSQRFLEDQAQLLDRRAQKGRVRDCHGDLHTAQVFFTDRGVRIIDCIEFADRFRYIDVACDTAFMAMDLDRAGRYDLSRAFLDAWQEVTRDRQAARLFDFYKVYFACVRGKVESLRLDSAQFSPEEKAEAARRARTYFNLAYYYIQRRSPPVLLLSTGLIGAGKSTLARFAGGDAGFAVISSDVVRKRLAGVPADSRSYSAFESGFYTPEFSKRTYEELIAQARPLLLDGHSAVLDATFGRRWQREAAADLARETGAEYWVVECVAEERDVRERLRRRQARGTGVSDGRWDIYLRERGSFEPMDDVPPDRHLVVHTSGRPVADSVRFVLGRLGVD